MPVWLPMILLVPVVTISSFAVFGGAGIVVFVIVLMMAAILNGRMAKFGCLIVPVLLFAMLIVLLAPAVRAAREAARRMTCCCGVCEISLALANYEQTYSCFPPAYIPDKDGKPMHSWRVLLLPFIESKDLYDQYNFNEPWDGPNNKKLLAKRPNFFACPSDETSQYKSDKTAYVAIVGKNAFFLPDKSRSSDELSQPGLRSKTVMIAEIVDSNIPWTEPRDFSLDELETRISQGSSVQIGSKHFLSNSFFYHNLPGGAWISTADWSRPFVHASALASDRLKNWLSVGGYNQEEIDALQTNSEQDINWANCFALSVWLVSVGILFFRVRRSREKVDEVMVLDDSPGGC